MKILKPLLYLFLPLLLGNCSKEQNLPEDPILDLGGENWKETELDRLIYEQFTKKYNIEIKYKWNAYETNYNRTLVPVLESQVIPLLTAIDRVWIKPYEKLAGDDFLKNNPVSKFVVIGSPEYQSDGSLVLGSAEGGSKITLYNINQLLIDNIPSVSELFQIIHHEYTHILNQRIIYPLEWQTISAKWYTPTWYNSNQVMANSQGLITPYAKASAKEDFAETVAFLLINGQADYDWIIDQYPESAAIFRRKEQLVKDYFQINFDINFKDLQREVQDAIYNLVYSNPL